MKINKLFKRAFIFGQIQLSKNRIKNLSNENQLRQLLAEKELPLIFIDFSNFVFRC